MSGKRRAGEKKGNPRTSPAPDEVSCSCVRLREGGGFPKQREA